MYRPTNKLKSKYFLLYEMQVLSLLITIIFFKLQGALVIAATKTGKVIFWNRRSFRCESMIKCHETQINSIAYFDEKFYTVGE
jgi:hypothetical protein